MSEPAKALEGEVEKPRKNGRKPLAVVEAAAPPTPVADAWLQTVKDLAPVIGIEGVRELMTMRREEQARLAEREFNAAMAAAKAEFEPVVKKHLVQYGEGTKRTSYKHEDLADIAEIVDPALANHGLYCRFRGSSNVNEPISVTCIVAHRSGHSEETTLMAGADNSGGKNSIQAVGSTVTYLQRYTQRLALGIATRRADDDGKAAGMVGNERITEQQAAELKALIVSKNANIGVFYKLFDIEEIESMPAAKFSTAKTFLEMKKG